MLRGFASVGFGVAVYTEPGITLSGLALLYSGYGLFDGAMTILGATEALCADNRWGLLFLEGVVGLTAGLAAVPRPGMTLQGLAWVMAIRAGMTGLAQIITSERLRSRAGVEWLPAVGGFATLGFIATVALSPVRNTLDLALWSGGCSMICGPVLVAFGHWLRTWIKSNNLGDYVPSSSPKPQHGSAASSHGSPGL